MVPIEWSDGRGGRGGGTDMDDDGPAVPWGGGGGGALMANYVCELRNVREIN